MAEQAQVEILLEGMPSRPGCYLMKDRDGKVIYVGKAINLKNRVRSYFHASASHSPKINEMVSQIEDIEWIVVGSELEALILEMNLIKRHRPKYNVRLKDDKRYPYIRVHWADPFPKVTVTRRMVDDGSRYYGPYTSMWAVHRTLDVVRKIFPYLTCDRVITGEDKRACLYYDIKLCLAPCIGAVNQVTYREMIEDLCQFLEGKSEPIIARLEGTMDRAARNLEYERAAAVRDQIAAIQKVVEGQRVVSQDKIDSDVIAFAKDEVEACVQVFFVRGGKLIGREYFVLDGAQEADDAEILAGFVKQYYAQAAYVPRRVLLPSEIEESRIIEAWLNQKREGAARVRMIVPQRGAKRALVKMAAENATETLSMLRAKWQADHSRHVEALAQIQDRLQLPGPPNRIECYDISNLQGTAASGSMIVFEKGTPTKSLYRKFTIRSVQGQDDFASMGEVLERRFKRWRSATEAAAKPGGKLDPAFGRLPNLLIVDGGKGQLTRALEVLRILDLDEKVPLAALAKEHEELYLPGRKDPIILDRRSEGLYLVERIRDEAHRFALSHHRTRRRKGIASQLDSISGIGPARRKALLKTFGDIDGIRAARVEELMKIPGLSRELAERVKAEL
jgi:excinuclease ABC subunit C